MHKKKGYLPGCLGVLWAFISLACGGGALTSSGPAVNRDYLALHDVILVHARSGDGGATAVYAVKRGESEPTLWPSTLTDDLTAVTTVSHVYMGHRRFPYYDKTPFYYGVNGLHVALPLPEYTPLPDRLRPPQAEDSRLEVFHFQPSPDGRYLAFQSSHAGTASIHIADLPQQTVTELYKLSTSTHAASGFTMSWSPDSRQIAFLGLGKCETAVGEDVLATGSRTYCHRDVYIVAINGGQAQRVTNTSEIRIDPEYTIGWLKTDHGQ